MNCLASSSATLPKAQMRTSNRHARHNHGLCTAFTPCGTSPTVQCSPQHVTRALSNETPVDSFQTIDRRQLLLRLATATAALAPAVPSYADDTPAAAPVADYVSYTDSKDQFSISVPSDWASGEGSLGGNASFTGASGSRRTVAWFPTDVNARDVNITLVMSNTSMEFTKLGSFGNAFQFGTNLVNSMDRSYLLRSRAPPKEPIQIARLEDAVEKSDKYFIDYTIEKPPEAKKHLYSLVALGYNGTYNRLYTLTAQCPDAEVDKYKKMFDRVLKSFQPPVTRMY